MKIVISDYPDVLGRDLEKEYACLREVLPEAEIVTHPYTDAEAFFREIDKARQLGYALDNEENEMGVRCIAAAIPDYRGHAFYAISLSAPATRMPDERIIQLRGPLLCASRDIAQALGGVPGR